MWLLAADSSDWLDLPTMLMIAGVVLLGLLLLVNTRRKIVRGQAKQLTPRERVERAKQTQGMKDDLRQMMVELEDLTRRFSSQLDAKSARLERLIDEADRRIEQLEQTGDGTASPPAAESTNAPESAEPAEEPPADQSPADPLAAEVYSLADQGYTAFDIARQLKQHIGTVELILALRAQTSEHAE